MGYSIELRLVSQFSEPHWLGLIADLSLKGSLVFREVCKDWADKIRRADLEDLKALIKNPKQLTIHLESLIEEDPEMCADIIEAIARRVDDASVLIILKLKAAQKFATTAEERARAIAEANLGERDPNIRIWSGYIFRAMGDELKAREVLLDTLL